MRYFAYPRKYVSSFSVRQVGFFRLVGRELFSHHFALGPVTYRVKQEEP